MSLDGDEKQLKCVKGVLVNFHRVSSIVREIGEPCRRQSPIKISKMLKPDKWQSAFDSEGKIFGFKKMLKLITLGGVDPSIRPEVWEFLLGCYSLTSTADYRRQLRNARRERYKDLVEQCQTMHSSIGTGSLAYVVGSKVMDVRISYREDVRSDAKVQSGQIVESHTDKVDDNYVLDNKHVDKLFTYGKEGSSNNPGDLVSVRGNSAEGAYDSSGCVLSPDPSYCCLPDAQGLRDSNYAAGNFLDFPAPCLTDLFEENGKDWNLARFDEDESLARDAEIRYEDASMHSFKINNNEDLIADLNIFPLYKDREMRREDEFLARGGEMGYEDASMHSFKINSNEDLVAASNIFPSNDSSLYDKSKSEISRHVMHGPLSRSNDLAYESEMPNGLRISDAPETTLPKNATTSQDDASEDKVTEWLWTLHRIVVDVVRTDSHLEFYEDTKNLARMSDILAVYAWVDPATGYCQGMSDLLSPFVVLFEDDADAFWCFEMLLRRVTENFKMEGPTGVMKQLQALWNILELTDREMFSHLSHIGAESLHFAFRMLLVLFRRELSFDEALCMWEMMWAADYDASVSCILDKKCPSVLAIQVGLPKEREGDLREESTSFNGGIRSPSAAKPFCGLTNTFWPKSDHFQIRSLLSGRRNGDDELPVFCVAAILVMNSQKIVRETRSIDDLIKIFNDNILKIKVKRCIRTAIKLRKKYFYKLIKRTPLVQNDSS